MTLNEYFFSQIGDDIDGESASDRSGKSVSLSSNGSIVAIGAMNNKDNGTNSGQVRIYQNVNDVWTKMGSDINGENANDFCGNKVSISSNGLIVAISSYGSDSNRGMCRIFKYVNSDWEQIGSNIIGISTGERCGSSVSISSDGTIVAVGSYLSSILNGSSSGITRVFQNVSDVWYQVGQNITSEGSGDLNGGSVSLSSDGTIIAVGAAGNDDIGSNSGHVRIFEYNNINNEWNQVGTDIDGEAAGDQSGISVSLSSDGTIVAIGAGGNDGNGSNSGHVRIFEYTDSSWTQVGSDIDGEAEDDKSGESVSISSDGKTVAIGSNLNDENALNAGHTRIYKNDNGTWVQIANDIDGESSGDYSSGSISLSSDGKVIAIGATNNSNSNGTYSGHTRIFSINEIVCFLKGTYILTSNGEKLIEEITYDDLITVSDGRNVKIKYIKKQIDVSIQPYLIPKNYFCINVPNKDTYISRDHLIKPPNKPWTYSFILNNVNPVKVKESEFYNIALQNYATDILVANGMKCDSLHKKEEAIFYIPEGSISLYLKDNLTDEEKNFVENND